MALKWFYSNGMRPMWQMWIVDPFSTTSMLAPDRRAPGARFSPVIHRLSTPHPEASVDIIELILSANAGSLATWSATFSHAYNTVV